MGKELVPSTSLWPGLSEHEYIDNVPAMRDERMDIVHRSCYSEGNKDMVYMRLGVLDTLNELIGTDMVFLEGLDLDVDWNIFSRIRPHFLYAVLTGTCKRPYRR